MPDGLTSRRPKTTERVRRLKGGESTIVIGSYRGQLAAFELADRDEAERCRKERPMAGSIRLHTGQNCRDK
jgi:hypothetical protein